MAYDYSTPPPGYHFYENKPSAYDYSTPTPGYATYGFKRNDATSPSVKHPYPYTTKGQHANEPSRRGHTRQASYSSVASLNPDSTRPKFQGADLSPEVAPDKSYEKDTEEANNPFAFSPGQLNKFLNPKPMASWKDLGGLDDLEQGPQTDVAGVKYSSVEPLATKNHPSKPRPVDHPSRSLGPAKPLWDPNNDDPTTRRTARRDRQSGHVNEPSKNDQWQSIIARIKQKSKENHDSSLSKIYQDQPYNRPMPNVPKTISPKDALLDFDDAEEDAMTSLFPQNTVREESMTPGVGGPSRKVSPGLPRPATFKRQEGEKRERLTPVESPSRVGSLLRTKQGLVGFANGSSIAAMADTGSRKNVISASYAKKLDLSIEGLPSTFAIGNSRKIQSLGTASLHWTFADKPTESFPILCYVLPYCTYDLILGNSFLTATKTLTEFCHRLTKCLFRVVNNISHFSFLGETCQRLHGTLADDLSVYAIPDTGADSNVMSLQFALENGLEIQRGPKHCGYLQFADGSYDLTVGQVKTHWTFASGERIPVTFEVLEYCCSDVIIGEEILTEHNVFQKHEASIVQTAAVDDDCFELAPFDFVNSWQKGCEKIMVKAWRRAKDDSYPRNGTTGENVHTEEQHRRNVWNHKYAFGTKASLGEGELERARRERYESLHSSRQLGHMDDQTSADANRNQQTEQRMPVIPSIPTSQTPR